MAGAGYKNWTAGDVPTAAQFDTYLQEQTTMVFPTAAARDTALSTAKSEGMLAYLLDTNTLTVYTGSAWVTLINPMFGQWTNWTPVITQGATPAITVTSAVYMRVGRMVTFEAIVTLNASGTAGNDITVSIPVAGHARYGTLSMLVQGYGQVNDTSAAGAYHGPLIAFSAGAFRIKASTATGTTAFLGSQTFTAALASGDNVMWAGTYEASADA